MPSNDVAQTAAEKETAWNVFLANWNKNQALTNATNLGTALASGVQSYNRKAAEVQGYVAAGLGKVGNVQFNSAAATGDGTIFGAGLVAGDYGLDIDIAANEDPLAGLYTARTTAQDRIDEIDEILTGEVDPETQELIDSWGAQFEGKTVGETVDMLESLIAEYKKAYDEADSKWWKLDRKRQMEHAKSRYKDLEEKLEELEALNEGRQGYTDERKALVETLATMDEVIAKSEEMVGIILGTDDSPGLINNNPVAVNQTLNLTSGSTTANIGTALTDIEIGRRNLINNGVSAIYNLVGEAAMADYAAAYEADMGVFTQRGLDIEEQINKINTFFTMTNFALSLFK